MRSLVDTKKHKLSFEAYSPYVAKRLPQFLGLEEIFALYGRGKFIQDGEVINLSKVMHLAEPMDRETNQPMKNYLRRER